MIKKALYGLVLTCMCIPSSYAEDNSSGESQYHKHGVHNGCNTQCAQCIVNACESNLYSRCYPPYYTVWALCKLVNNQRVDNKNLLCLGGRMWSLHEKVDTLLSQLSPTDGYEVSQNTPDHTFTHYTEYTNRLSSWGALGVYSARLLSMTMFGVVTGIGAQWICNTYGTSYYPAWGQNISYIISSLCGATVAASCGWLHSWEYLCTDYPTDVVKVSHSRSHNPVTNSVCYKHSDGSEVSYQLAQYVDVNAMPRWYQPPSSVKNKIRNGMRKETRPHITDFYGYCPLLPFASLVQRCDNW